ncbi:hypothetical protein BGZ82_002841 [Podila clonocystis]|nr:hypothetical protein BGZ82_002841 [Podila clonocystis]
MAHHSKTPPRRNTLSILTIALVAPALLCNSFTLAQTVTGAAAYVQVRGKFYVHGGEYASQVVSNQLLSLDLTKPWPTNAPAWTTLSPSPFVNSYHVATHSPDNKTLYFLGFNSGAGQNAPLDFLNSYSIETNTWLKSDQAQGVSTKDRRDFQGGLDPTTGRYMFLGGNYGVSGGNKSNMVNVFDTRSGAFVAEALIPVLELSYVQGNVVSWIGHGTRPGLYVLAGESSSATGAGATMVPTSKAHIYNTTSAQWSSLDIPFAPSPAPSNRVRACVASNDDSSSLVIFGGFNSGDTGTKALIDVYIMDSKTMTWKAGAAMADPVGYPACTIASNQLIVWGGFTTSHGIPPQSNTMRVYDLGANKWTSTYTPSTDYLISLGLLPPNKPTASPGGNNGTNGGDNGNGGNTPDGNSNSGSDKKSITPIIIGAVVGAVVLILLVAGFILFKRRRNRRKPSINKTSIKVQPDYNGNTRRYTAPPPPPPQNRFKHMTFLSPAGTTTTGSSSPSPSSATLNHSRDKTEYTQSEPTTSLYELSTLSPDQHAMLLAEDQANSSPGPSPTVSPFHYSQGAAQRASMISSNASPSSLPVMTTSSATNFLQAPSHISNNHRHSIASSTTGTAPSLLPFLLDTGSNGTGSVRYSTVSSGSGFGPPPTFASTGVQTIESVPLPPRPSLSDASMRTASTFIVAPPTQIPLPPIDDDDNDPPFKEGPAVSTAPIQAVGGPKTDYMPLPNLARPQSMAFGPEPTPCMP